MLLFGFIFGASGQDWNCFYDYMFVVRDRKIDRHTDKKERERERERERCIVTETGDADRQEKRYRRVTE